MPWQKGILGVAKDPKKNILFSFGGELCGSDDSEDSDYAPTAEEAEKEGLASPARKKKSVRKKEEDSLEKSLSPTVLQTSGPNWWGDHIPQEILTSIFRFYIRKEGALPFLCRAARVCRRWHETSQLPSLWSNLDLSYGWIKSEDKTLEKLHNSGKLSQLQHVNLSSWKQLTNTGMQVLSASCPHLESVNLSYCTKLNSQAIKELVDGCPHLKSIDLSFTSLDCASPQSVKYVVTKCGTNLQHLNISGNPLKSVNIILNTIMVSCQNLEILEICNCIFSTDFVMLNIEKFAAACPKMKILRLANSKFQATSASARAKAESPGFPKLEELSLAVNPEGINTGMGINDDFLERILKTSQHLRLLDLRGSSQLTTRSLQALTITDLEHLFISQSSIAKYDGIEAIMQKWQHSLVELDLSWNVYPGMSLDTAMHKLAYDPAKSQLSTLNLCGTCICATRIKSILLGCPNLTSLNLVSCRSLPRGMKREYQGKDLEKLRKEIDDIIERETIEVGDD